jgi:hypothetical protein
VGNFDDHSISVLDVSTKRVIDTIKLPNSAIDIQSSEKYVWVLLSNLFSKGVPSTQSRILKFNASNRNLLSSWNLWPCTSLPCDTNRLIDGEVSGIATSDSSLWFCYSNPGKLTTPIVRINMSTDSSGTGLTIPSSCSDVWVQENMLVILKDQTLYFYDERDFKRLGVFIVDQADGFVEDIQVTKTSIYLTVYDFFKKNASTFFYEIDISNLQVTERLEVPAFYISDFQIAEGRVWSVGSVIENQGIKESKLITFTTNAFRTQAKAAAELKARQDAEAKAAAELKAKQEAAAKAAALKKTTITCVKGKLTKKVTARKPKCPSGYKVKK